ncbi:MAG: ATP-binding protein [Kiritimatiellae bacterium]|nr:ATP-binding protein [Kiritimatiellia bacterium]
MNHEKRYIDRKLDVCAALSHKSVFLFGPRQCGKSSLLDHTIQNANVFDLLSSETFLRLSSDPGYLESCCTDDRPVVIDEIQKLPSLLDEVHRLIERKGLRFVLTGSSARKLRQGGVNLLGGRARVKRLHPFSAIELGSDFDLDRALNFGLLPNIWFSDEPEEDLADYIDEYLRQEIIAEGATRNLPAFSRFLEVAALSSGEQIDYTSIANDAKVPRTTVQEYFRILKETLLADEVPVWKQGTRRKTVETAKFYLFDTGVSRRLSRRKEVVPLTQEYGHLFEAWVHHELRSYLDCTTRDGAIEYWRTTNGTEVDFIVGNCAIEVKSGTRIAPGDIKGLKAIADEGEFRHRLVVCRENVPRQVDGVEIVPYPIFVQRLWGGELV